MNGEPGLQPSSLLPENPHFSISLNFADVATVLQANKLKFVNLQPFVPMVS